MSEYHAIHRAARLLRGDRCEKCGSTARLQMALDPATPRYLLRFDATVGCWYSIDPTWYRTLCPRDHARMDARTREVRDGERRVRRAAARAPRCSICSGPMLAGQRGSHLSCADQAARTG